MGKKYSGLEPLNTDDALIYIYRPSLFFQGGTWPTVFIDGEDKYLLKNGGFVSALLPPGTHKIKIGKAHFLSNWAGSDIEVEIKLESKKRYFLKLDLEAGNVNIMGNYMSISGSVGLIQIPEETAINELKELNSSM